MGDPVDTFPRGGLRRECFLKLGGERTFLVADETALLQR